MFVNSGKQLISSIVSRNLVRAMSSTESGGIPSYKTLAVKETTPFVYHVELNRPDRLNAFNSAMWHEIGDCFNNLSNNQDCRAIVLTGSGKHFTAGLDLKDSFGGMQSIVDLEVGRKGLALSKMIKLYQDSISSLENCAKPVIVGIHAACIGAGVDLITSADIRYCTEDAYFSVMEVNIGMAADVGTLQRLPKVINSQSLVRELCFTGRKMASQEAVECGLVSKKFKTREEMIENALKLADDIAKKSPVAVQATKKNLIYSLDHTNQEGLDHIREMNQLLLQSEDFANAIMAQATKSDAPVFSKL